MHDRNNILDNRSPNSGTTSSMSVWRCSRESNCQRPVGHCHSLSMMFSLLPFEQVPRLHDPVTIFHQPSLLTKPDNDENDGNGNSNPDA